MIYVQKSVMDIGVVVKGVQTTRIMSEAFKDLCITQIGPTKILIEAPVSNEWFTMQITRCEWFMLGLERGYIL